MLRSAVQSREVQFLFSPEGLFLGTGAHPTFLLPTRRLPGSPRSLNSFSSSSSCCSGLSSCTFLTPNLKPPLFCGHPLRLWGRHRWTRDMRTQATLSGEGGIASALEDVCWSLMPGSPSRLWC